MGEILTELLKSITGLVGITERGEEVNLSLPFPEIGLLGKLPKGIKLNTPEYKDWEKRMVKEKILDNPPYPRYVRLGISSYMLKNRNVLIPYDIYDRD